MKTDSRGKKTRYWRIKLDTPNIFSEQCNIFLGPAKAVSYDNTSFRISQPISPRNPMLWANSEEWRYNSIKII